MRDGHLVRTAQPKATTVHNAILEAPIMDRDDTSQRGEGGHWVQGERGVEAVGGLGGKETPPKVPEATSAATGRSSGSELVVSSDELIVSDDEEPDPTRSSRGPAGGWRDRISSFYATKCPTMLPGLDEVLERYRENPNPTAL